MQSVTSSKSFREILKSFFSEKCERNSRYSLRAFARDLGVSAGHLSEVLENQHGLSNASATKIGKKIGLTGDELVHFCDLVELDSGRNQTMKQLARERIQLRLQQRVNDPISLDLLRVVGDWYHMVILELTYLPGFKKLKTQNEVTEYVAKRLKLPVLEAKHAVMRLLQIQMLVEENGTFKAAEDFTFSSNHIPSEVIKKYHQQILSKASDALADQSLEEREFNCVTFSFDLEQMPHAKEDIRKFKREFLKKYNNQNNPNSVYSMSIQLFQQSGE